jgi:hypothetical protein
MSNGRITKLPPIGTADHCVILLNQTRAKKMKKFTRCYKKSAKIKCLLDIAEHDWNDVIQLQDANSKAEQFNNIIQNILDKNCPYKQKLFSNSTPPWMSDEIFELIKKRNKCYKIGNVYWKIIRNRIVSKLRTSKRNYIAENINNMPERNTANWWKLINALEGRYSKPEPPLLLLDNKWVNKSDFANEMNIFFLSQGNQSNEMTTMSASHTMIDNTTDFMAENVITPTTLSEVKLLLKKVKPKKSSRQSGTPSWILKEAAEDLTVVMTDVINACLQKSHFPALWKFGDITTIEKVNNATSKSHFRPITLLDSSSKILEKIICNRYKLEIEDKLEKNQHAYLEKGSTVNALIAMFDDWTLHLDDCKCKAVRLLIADFSKAFDRMNHTSLIDKLENQFKINPNMTKMTTNFLKNRKQCVTNYRENLPINEDYKEINVGVPQGSVLGPWLWITYVDDLSSENGCAMHKYADDTTAYQAIFDDDVELEVRDLNYCEIHPENNYLQKTLTRMEDWSKNNNMLLNKTKTVEFTLTLKKNVEFEKLQYIDGTAIKKSTTSEKILGIIVDKHLTFKEHVQMVTNKCNKRLHWLRTLKKNGVSEENLVLLYTCKIRSIVTYAAPAWFPVVSTTLREKIEKLQKRACKFMNSDLSYDDFLDKHNLPRLCNFMEKLQLTHFIKILNDINHPLHFRLPLKISGRTRQANLLRVPYSRTFVRTHSFFPASATLYNNSLN